MIRRNNPDNLCNYSHNKNTNMKEFTEYLLEEIVNLDELDLSEREYTLAVERLLMGLVKYDHTKESFYEAVGLDDDLMKLNLQKAADIQRKMGEDCPASKVIELSEQEFTKRELAALLFVVAAQSFIVEKQLKTLTTLLGVK